jgi:hypothetical protein
MGISSQKALHLVETAAKGATTGHAKLVDVTNALTAAVASGIPGVQNMDQAMGVLNATVGVGDMKMQDLANAFGSGMVATVKGFGLNIRTSAPHSPCSATTTSAGRWRATSSACPSWRSPTPWRPQATP